VVVEVVAEMTGEYLAICILGVMLALVVYFWRADHWAFADERRELLTRIQSQVPAVLDRQDAHEERQAELRKPEQEAMGEEVVPGQREPLVEVPEMTPAEGRAAVARIHDTSTVG
jgi:type VI protein secretion system component VasK